MNNFPARAAEFTHSKACNFAAVVCAMENIRDREGMTDVDFVIALQSGEALAEAQGYLIEGMTACICPDSWE